MGVTGQTGMVSGDLRHASWTAAPAGTRAVGATAQLRLEVIAAEDESLMWRAT
jgi:hypothetical protein